MKAIVIHAARDLRIEDRPVEDPQAGQLRLSLATGGICGSDLHYYNHGGFGAVVGEVARLSMTASRRLQLVAEDTGSLGLAVRRWRRQAEAADFGQPTAAATRWRVTALPSAPLPVAGVGRPRWFVELIRCRAGACADFELEACDETGRLALPPHLADRSAATPSWTRRAVA